jgi:hypothetical protein
MLGIRLFIAATTPEGSLVNAKGVIRLIKREKAAFTLKNQIL